MRYTLKKTKVPEEPYCDFRAVMDIILRNIGDAQSLNRVEILDEIFATCLADPINCNYTYPASSASRWINGRTRVNPRISGYYLPERHLEALAHDIQQSVLQMMHASQVVVDEMYDLVQQDCTIPRSARAILTAHYPAVGDQDKAMYIAKVLQYAMGRPLRFDR